MMTRFILILSFLFFSMVPLNDQPICDQISNKLINYSLDHPLERVYLHTDKPFYVAGEDIWFKAYLMVGPYQVPDTLSSVLYVELIKSDGNITDRRMVHIKEGLGYGDFDLPAGIAPGKYMLRAYTQYMRNYDAAFYFRKGINILPVLQKERNIEKKGLTAQLTGIDRTDINPIRIQFFPEGGDMVEGLQNYIAFKATDNQGIGVDVEGTVKNSKGIEITRFKSKKFGLGYFSLSPDPGEEYTAFLSYENRVFQFPLPYSKKRGYVMHIAKTGDNLYIWVRNNMGMDMNKTFVIGHYRGFPFITIHANPGQNFLYSVFNIKEIPGGIMNFTFFDSLAIPQCERLVFNENENEKVNFSIESDKKVYKKRQKASFNIHCTDLKGKSILTNISLSITNKSIVNPDSTRSNILSYFNLESDLKETIEHPAYYFNPGNKDRFELLDLLLLTHGWRRFVWKEILGDQPSKLEFLAEAGFSIRGRLVDFYDQTKIQPGYARLFFFKNKLKYSEIKTSENGSFQFEGLDIHDSTQVLIQAWRLPTKAKKLKPDKLPKTKNDLAIQIVPQTYAPVDLQYWPEYILEPETMTKYLDQNDFILKTDSSFGGRPIMLGELLVKSTKIKEDPFDRPGKLYANPSYRIVMDSISVADQSNLLFNIIRKYVPNIRIIGAPPDVQIIIRGQNSLLGSGEALILLDGIPVEADFMYYFFPAEIAFIDVLTTSRAAMYGGRVGSGVIAFYTKSQSVPNPAEGRMGMINFVQHGYSLAREFYSPNYDIKDEKQAKPDYRRTLYWKPSLTTNDQGKIEFSFFTSDENAEYRVEIEGMTYSGIPIVRDYYFSVQ